MCLGGVGARLHVPCVIYPLQPPSPSQELDDESDGGWMFPSVAIVEAAANGVLSQAQRQRLMVFYKDDAFPAVVRVLKSRPDKGDSVDASAQYFRSQSLGGAGLAGGVVLGRREVDAELSALWVDGLRELGSKGFRVLHALNSSSRFSIEAMAPISDDDAEESRQDAGGSSSLLRVA